MESERRDRVIEYVIQRVATTNDKNGNPRRGWIVYDIKNKEPRFIDQGYEGIAALYRAFPQLEAHLSDNIYMPEIDIPVKEYERLNSKNDLISKILRT